MIIIKGRTIKGPYIVTSGLVFYLDAANTKSYSSNAFPYPLDIYAYTGPNANQATITRDTTIVASPVGGIPLKMAISGLDPYTVSYNSLPFSFSTAAQGQTWTISVWIRASVSTSAGFYIFGANSSGTWIELGGELFSVTTSWVRYSSTFTFTNASTTGIQVRLEGVDSGGAGINVWFDGLQAERSSSATTFSSRYNQNAAMWNDISATNLLSTLTNDPTFNGSNGGSVVFDGINDYVSTTSNVAFASNPFSIDLWFKPDATQSTNATLICIAAAAASTNWQLSFNGTLCLQAGGSIVGTSNYTPTNNWVHVAVVRESTSTNASKFYINGVLDVSFTLTNNLTDTPGYRIGMNRGSNAFYKGNISSVRVYQKGLTSTEVLQNYNAQKEKFGLI